LPSPQPYAHLLSPWQIRHTRIANRVIFGPVCPTWVRSPHEGVFTEQAVAYYEERARTGIGMIILGGHLIDKDTLYTPAGFPGLWNEDQVEGLARVARAVKKHDCALIAQLLHIGLRSPTPFLKTDPARDPYEYNPYMLGPSQMPIGEIPGGPTPKELEEHEIEYILQCFAEAVRRAMSAGLDGSNYTSRTAICPGSSFRHFTITATTAGADRTRTGCGFRLSACAVSARGSGIVQSSDIASTRRRSGKEISRSTMLSESISISNSRPISIT
jgi:hypothetical protein